MQQLKAQPKNKSEYQPDTLSTQFWNSVSFTRTLRTIFFSQIKPLIKKKKSKQLVHTRKRTSIPSRCASLTGKVEQGSFPLRRDQPLKEHEPPDRWNNKTQRRRLVFACVRVVIIIIIVTLARQISLSSDSHSVSLYLWEAPSVSISLLLSLIFSDRQRLISPCLCSLGPKAPATSYTPPFSAP